MRRRLAKIVQIALLIGLILAPVALAGHTHPASQLRVDGPCALCVVAYHSPIVTTVALVFVALLLIEQPLGASERVPVSETPESRPFGRAPPLGR